ncbi:MAG: hypothetical protein J5806_08555 [Lentisphaeria bacterium]|nr:hypothetical protein [Lentisphaeria bacterium]
MTILKIRIAFLFVLCVCCTFGAPRPVRKTFDWPNELKYSFLPKQKMTFINGVVKNKDERALPDIDAQYGNKVKADGRVFTLPGEICEAMSACYKADLNGDGIPDYVFVNVKVWNGRFAGQSDVAVFVSNREKKYVLNVFETRYLEALKDKDNPVMLVKYAYSDDGVTLIRQLYSFDTDGMIRLHSAEAFALRY